MLGPMKKTAGVAVVVVATMVITSTVVSRQHEQDLTAMQAEMEKWMELAQPIDIHREMAARAGTWTQENKHWMYPGQPPSVSTATTKLKSILGGRYLLETVRGEFEMNGVPTSFEGLGVHGYDRIKEKHFFAWFDNMSTCMMIGEGTADESGKVVTYYSEMPGPDGQVMKMKSVATQVGDDKTEFEMFYKMPDGTWFRNMHAVSVRMGR